MNSNFDKFYDDLNQKVKTSTEKILEMARKEKLAIKQHGFMADNIWLLDFKDPKSFSIAEKLINSYTVPNNVAKINYYKKTNRIAFMF